MAVYLTTAPLIKALSAAIVKIEITSDKKFTSSSRSAASERKVSRSVRKSEKGTGLRVFMIAGGGR